MPLAPKGIDTRATGPRLVVRASLKDSAGARLTSGTTTLAILELQEDGNVKTYDFNDNTFKTTSCTTPTVNMTHRPWNNGSTSSGIWTYSHANLANFSKDGIYLLLVSNSGAFPVDQEREIQFGGAQGDLIVDPSGSIYAITAEIVEDAISDDALSAAAINKLLTALLAKALNHANPTSGTYEEALVAARAQGFGRWALVAGSPPKLNLYGPDNVTIIFTFNLDSATAPTERTPE